MRKQARGVHLVLDAQLAIRPDQINDRGFIGLVRHDVIIFEQGDVPAIFFPVIGKFIVPEFFPGMGNNQQDATGFQMGCRSRLA